MKIFKTLTAFAAALIIAAPAVAANSPLSMRLVAYSQTAAGEDVRHYQVTCSSGKKVEINQFKAQRQWCTEGGSDCSSRKVSAAKMACNSNRLNTGERLASVR